MSLTPITEKLYALCGNDTEAVKFVNDFWSFCVVWDDLIDKDKGQGDEAINNAMMWALFGMQDDPFYRKYQGILRASIMQCIANWMTANKFEQSHEREKVEQAYVLRCSPYDVFATVALLTGGFQKQLEAVEYLRSFTIEDRLDDYLSEHKGA